MLSALARPISLILVLAFVATPLWATCGGGGGGGGGGTSGTGGNGGGSTNNPVVYHVPWKNTRTGKAEHATEGLVLYWFPADKKELQTSQLKESRVLSLYASQCVSMELADTQTPNAADIIGDSKLPIAALTEPDGALIKKVENTGGKLKVSEVEKAVTDEVKAREAKIDETMKDAKAKAAGGDNAEAIRLYKTVVDQKCMFARKAKTAAGELKKLGAENIGSIPAAPRMDARTNAAMSRLMKRGLIAENGARYITADKLYEQAHQMDPADPTPLRYLAELHRHHIGNWDKAKAEFHEILSMQADPLSRAVALHGLGKITIHEGEFKKGLSLMEQSVEEYPLALAYRNLAVYWHSEHDLVKGNYYTEKALALDPTDPYNLVFSAVFMAAGGKKEEALKIAKANIGLLPASYNLAAIFALNGQRDKALEILKRHFYQYERYHAVREKEMMEARVDAVFDSLRNDEAFLDLTKYADGMLPMPMSPRAADQMRMNDR